MDLFEAPRSNNIATPSSQPLAARLAPKAWDDYVGQSHLVSQGALLRVAIEKDRLNSCIFFGPAGTGKTALARLAATHSKAAVEYLNAVTAGVNDLRQVVNRSAERRKLNGQKTLVVIDEIHHFNRTQQDALLPYVERGDLIMIGLTTENPYFYVNAALVSRSSVFEFKPLQPIDLEKIINRAIQYEVRGQDIHLTDEARSHFIRTAEGDARRLLNAIEWAFLLAEEKNESKSEITLIEAQTATQKKAVRYDKSGDDHYDTISAFIKSLRGSDPDAALYWMAKMLEAGEDPRFIARRIVIFSSEDVGNADPNAIVVAMAAAQAVAMIGLPEARINLAQAVTYVATAPKSNASYVAYEAAVKEVRDAPNREVPNHLKDSSLDQKSLGHGQGYEYPHNFPGHYVEQIYMPDKKNFYTPSTEGYEETIKARLELWRTPKK